MGLSNFRDSMLDCEIYRNGIKISENKGLISDSKNYNVIQFEPESNLDIQIGDEIYCPIKRKYYKIINTDIETFKGKPFSISAYFENNFNKPISNTNINVYNPNNSIIGNQQSAIININDSFEKFQNQIDTIGAEDKAELQELLNLLRTETTKNQIDKSIFSRFGSLISKHASWLFPMIADIITAWIQH